jgi:hypothetical protein
MRFPAQAAITLNVTRWVCIGWVFIGWVSGVVFTKYQSSTLFHLSVSVTGWGSPYGRALRFSFQRGVSAATSFSVIIRAATDPPLSSRGPRLVSSVTLRLADSDPGPGTLIGAPLDALCFTVICMTRISDGAGVDTGSGGSMFVMSSLWPANRRKSQITSNRSAGGGELVEGAEHAAVQAAALQFGEPPLDLADPGGVGGREVQLDPGWASSHLCTTGALCADRLSQIRWMARPGSVCRSISLRKSRKSMARCWADRWPITLPVAVFSAANRSMVPCRT